MAVYVTEQPEGRIVHIRADEDHGLYVVAEQLVATAGRNHVHYLVDVDQLPPGVRDAAEAVHRELMRDADADLRHYVTTGRSR